MEEKIYHIISNKLSGTLLSEQDTIDLNNWLLLDNNAEIFEELKAVWDLSGSISYKAKVNVDDEWARFKSNIPASKNNKTKRLVFSTVGIAASILLLIGLFITSYTKTIVYQYSDNASHFELPDHSQVWLNSNSSIEFSSKFGKKSRQLKLSGEAFFSVTKSNVPFVVSTNNNVDVKVLGTQFNIKNYSTDKVAELTVVRGKVAFGNAATKQIEIVEKGNSALYFKDFNKVEKVKGLNKNKISWHTGNFRFDNQPLHEVVALLEDYMKVSINIPEAYCNYNFSGNFSNPSSNDVATVIGKAFNFNYTLVNQNITFADQASSQN